MIFRKVSVSLSFFAVIFLSIFSLFFAQPTPAEAVYISCPLKFVFTKDLQSGISDFQVQYLQTVLNLSPDTKVALSGVGSPGSESRYFGPATKAAVIRFQARYKLTQSGFVGPATRKILNDICNGKVSISTQGKAVAIAPSNPAVSVSELVTTIPQPSVAPQSQIVPVVPVPVSLPVSQTVSSNRSPIITSINRRETGIVGRMEAEVVATDADGDQITYSTQSLPNGATFNSQTRVFSWSYIGIPAGTYTVQFVVSDGKSSTNSQYDIVISESVTQPVNNPRQPEIPVQPPAQPLANPTFAYSWHHTSPAYSNITPMYWFDNDVSSAGVQRVITALQATPQGRRGIILSLHDIGSDPADKCSNPVTGYGFDCLWWDNGVKKYAAKMDILFKGLSAAGVTPDYLIMDYEGGQSYWWCENGCGPTYNDSKYKAFESDPRFPEVRQAMNALGFSASDTLQDIWNNKGTNYLLWGEVMYVRQAKYVTDATYTVARKYFPEISASNYGYVKHSINYKVPDLNGHQDYLYGNGAIVGNEQSPVIYGQFNLVGRGRPPEGVSNFAFTPFNDFKYSINVLRAPLLSDPSIPARPWVSHKSFELSSDGMSNQFVNTDYYQEMVFHTLLSGVKGLLYWNPHQEGIGAATHSDDALLSNILIQFDSLASTSDRQRLISGLTSWNGDYVITGMRIGNRVLYRFTPDASGRAAADTIVSAKNPVRLKTAQADITIPNAEIITPQQTLSRGGLWIVQYDTSGTVTVAQAKPRLFASVIEAFKSFTHNVAGGAATVWLGFKDLF